MPILIPMAEGVGEAGEVAVEGYEGYRAYRAAKAAEQAAKLLQAARALQAAKQGVQTDACSNCPPDDDDPCKHLERGTGSGPYRGGSHRQMTQPANDDLESHHLPPAASIKGLMSRNDGAAIQMTPEDHELTASYRSGQAAQAYRQQQTDLINQGKYREALARHAADARRVAAQVGDPHNYDEAIKEAEAYADCLEQHKIKPNNGAP